MKRLATLFLLFIGTFLNAQNVTIPDANFKTALIEEGVDTNGDGEIQLSEAEVVLDLGVGQRNISSLEGIQSFTSLINLSCSINQLVSLDLTQNLMLESLRCAANQLENLDVSENLFLKILICNSNELASLDVSLNLNLERLWVMNNELSSLDITQNTELEIVWCYTNQLTSLDVSQNSKLERLWCSSNLLTDIDVSQNISLETLACYGNLLTNLDVSQNLSLGGLACSNNQLSSLDLRQNINLEYLECQQNLLHSLFLNNGNTGNISTMISYENIDLTCIQVDDENANYPECGGFPITGWCVDEWSFYNDKCNLGLTNSESNRITLYPNPVEDILSLSAPNTVILSAVIYAINGKEVGQFNSRSEGVTEINISRLETGMYFLKLDLEDGQITKRIIKK